MTESKSDNRECYYIRGTATRTGQIPVIVTCPFCGEQVSTWLWSLYGSGKKCPCGALLTAGLAWMPESNKKPGRSK